MITGESQVLYMLLNNNKNSTKLHTSSRKVTNFHSLSSYTVLKLNCVVVDRFEYILNK